MPNVDIDRAGKLDKIHTKRILHAVAQVVLHLIRLEDERVDNILNNYSIALMPGPVVGIEYAPGVRQILSDELVAEKALEAAKSSVAAKKAKRKR